MTAVDARTIGIPLEADAPGCGVMVDSQDGRTGPSSCVGEAVATAVVSFVYDGAAWRMFLCAQHRALVPAAESMNASHRDELAERRRQHDSALAGNGWTPPTPIRPGRRPNDH